ncbi:MAG: molybdopterin synthase sulfur carrier subunit [Rhodospirillales bacterium CG15_BIG_FIL_POST_REV_8_21_14_020_66_15]|nr:MAG: molybdopterin synthase sulfur carrier subunit [Rhodospirillales bacterium CG15_BIG_FIL_POST_REV_8_21_14_020_66_15]
MNIRVKLYAALADYLPPGTKGNEADLEVTEAATPATVIAQLGLPEKMCHLVLLNGVYVEPSARAATTFRDGDALAMWPPVAGG